MESVEHNREKSRAIIQSVCLMLRYGRKNLEVFSKGIRGASADSFVLLTDATKMFCESISAGYGEKRADRWTPELPELLFDHPERCDETLSLVERPDFSESCHPWVASN